MNLNFCIVREYSSKFSFKTEQGIRGIRHGTILTHTKGETADSMIPPDYIDSN